MLVEQSEKDELAKLNLIAGEKAKVATAYEAAVRYLETGLALLTNDSWRNTYKLTLNLYIETAEAEYLSGNFEKSKQLGNIVLQKASNILDKV